MHHGAGDADALLLAGGKVGRVELGLVRQGNTLKRHAHALGDLRLGQAVDLHRQGDVVEHAAVEQQLVVLEHDAYLAAQEGNLCVGDLRQVLAGQQQLAGGGPLHRQQQAQQGAFPGAGVAGDEEELATADAEAQFVQAYVAIGVAFADLLESNHADSRSAKRALTKASASKVRRSSMPSPTPM
ncbi:hypothetical protein D9M71_646200 [compost metagenome]